MRTPVPKWLTVKRTDGGMRRRGNHVASTGNAQAKVETLKIIKSAPICREVLYSLFLTPPGAHVDRLMSFAWILTAIPGRYYLDSLEREHCYLPAVSETETVDLKYLPTLSWEMSAEVKRTDSSHHAQLLIFSSDDRSKWQRRWI
jgi:hypothetical protein